MTAFVAYYRVSTTGIGPVASGWMRSARPSPDTSGQGSWPPNTLKSRAADDTEPPEIAGRIAGVQEEKATLVIAKLDRLGRNVAFISALVESGAEFVCCDNPHANRLVLHMLAAFAEHEREQISQRTKDALAAAKARGVKLGNPRPAIALERARDAHIASRPAPEVLNIMVSLRQRGYSFRAIARELNRLNVSIR